MATLSSIGLAAISMTAVYKLLSFHSIHSYIWSCTERTNTNQQTRFENLKRYYLPDHRSHHPPSDNDTVTFDFAISNSTTIEVPFGSHWQTIRYCHLQQETCRQRELLKDAWALEQHFISGPRHGPPEKAGFWCSMSPLYGVTKDMASVRLFGSESGRMSDHVLVSAVQDAELYFNLCHTPLWIRGLFILTKHISSRAASILIRRILWIQLRTIFSRNDTLEYRGRCMVLRLYYMFYQPDWVIKFEIWSEWVFAKLNVQWSYFLGTVIFGMKPWYLEYELLDSPREK